MSVRKRTLRAAAAVLAFELPCVLVFCLGGLVLWLSHRGQELPAIVSGWGAAWTLAWAAHGARVAGGMAVAYTIFAQPVVVGISWLDDGPLRSLLVFSAVCGAVSGPVLLLGFLSEGFFRLVSLACPIAVFVAGHIREKLSKRKATRTP